MLKYYQSINFAKTKIYIPIPKVIEGYFMSLFLLLINFLFESISLKLSTNANIISAHN